MLLRMIASGIESVDLTQMEPVVEDGYLFGL